MGKKALCLIFAFLLSIESFAAVVSDNDGSAFVTKAEFEGLKKDFANQINNYNTSIDSKIDGAIASYLSGIRTEKKTLINSLLYAANESEPVMFTKNWVVPTTIIGDKYQASPFFWYLIVVKTYQVNAGVFVGGINAVMESNGLAQISAETVGNNDTIIVRPEKNQKYNKYFLTGSSFYKVLPQIFVISIHWHDGLANWWLNSNDTREFWYHIDCDSTLSNRNASFGTKNYSGQVHAYISYTDTYSYPCPLAYITQTTDTQMALQYITNGKNINRCSGGKVEGTIKTTLSEDWNTTDGTPFAVHNCATQRGFRSFRWLYSNTKGFTENLNPTYWITGIPMAEVYSKKNTDMLAINLIHNDWSNATKKEVTYYGGMPIIEATNNGVVELPLEFEVDGTGGAFFAIKNGPFSNSDTIDTSTLELYEDKDFNTRYTTNSFTGNSYEKTLYFQAKAGETYWIKVKPENDNDVKVNTSSKEVVFYQE